MENNIYKNIKCEKLKLCITRAMEFAQKNDFLQGRASFISDLNKNPCTKNITKQPYFAITILFGEIKSIDEFNTIISIVSLSHECTCLT